MSALRRRLALLGACKPALDWVGERDAEAAWRECRRADWLAWAAARTCPDRQPLADAICDGVRDLSVAAGDPLLRLLARAVKLSPAGDGAARALDSALFAHDPAGEIAASSSAADALCCVLSYRRSACLDFAASYAAASVLNLVSARVALARAPRTCTIKDVCDATHRTHDELAGAVRDAFALDALGVPTPLARPRAQKSTGALVEWDVLLTVITRCARWRAGDDVARQRADIDMRGKR